MTTGAGEVGLVGFQASGTGIILEDAFLPNHGGFCGTGFGNISLPGDPNLSTPNLSASSAFGGILVSWTYPTLNPNAVAHVLLYRGTENNFNTASLLRTVTGDSHFDRAFTEADIVYYYWIQVVSVQGTVGTVIGPASAVMQAPIQEIIDALVGKVTSSTLDIDLRTEINTIVSNKSILDTEILDRLAGENLLSQAILDAVADLDILDTLVINETNQRITADSAQVDQINVILAQSDDNTALILAEATTRADADTAISNTVTALQTTVGDNAADIVTESTARANQDTALAQSIATLATTVGNNAAAIVTTNTAFSDADTAISTSVTELATSVGNNNTAIVNEATARSDGDTAVAATVTALASSVNTNTAAISTEATTRSAADTAQAALISALQTSVGNNAAAIVSSATTSANAVSAVATSVETLEATVGDNTSLLESTAEVVSGENGLTAQYTLKTDVNGLVSGYGLYNDGTATQFSIRADTFSVGSATYADVVPFIIDTVDGVPTIALNAATLIPDASIGNASIGNTIQSTGYSASTAGWQLKKDFGFTLRGAAGAIQMQVQTGGGTEFGADISNSAQTYAAITGTKPPANAAVNAPSIGAKINYLNFADANNGELYIHGFNAEGQADDVPGYISYNGEQISIQGQILTGTANSTGFLMYDPDPVDLTGYVRPYLVNSQNRNKVFAKKEGQQWSYDNNDLWVPFTPSATAVVFGDAITATQDVVASANVWGYGRSPASIVDPAATKGANSSNLAVGSGVNLVANASFDEGLQNLSFWENGPVEIALDYSPAWTLDNGHTIYVRQLPTDPDPDDKTNIQFGVGTDTAAVTIGERLEASLYVGAHRCSASLLMMWLNSTGGYLSSTLIEIINPNEASGGSTIDGYRRMGGFVTVPNIAGLSYGTLVLQKQGTEPGESGSFVFATRPMLARAFPNQTELSEWNPGTSKTNWVNIPDRPDASALLNNQQTFLEIQGDKPHIDAEPNARLDSNLLQVFAPLGAAYNSSNTQTGAIVVFLPQLWSNTMLMFDIANFGYGSGASSKSFVATVGGYTASSRSDWYKTSAKIQGYIGGNNRIRFGTNGTKAVVVIGDDDSTWFYPKIAVKNLQAGYSNYGVDQWKDGWDIDIVSDLSGYTFSGGNNNFSDALLDAQAAESSIVVEGESSYRYYGYGYSNSAATVALGGLRDNDGVDLGGFGGDPRSYILHVYNRTSETWDSHTRYDVYGTSALATQLATDINAHDSTKILVVTGQHAPAQNRLLGGLPEALYNIGGSRTVFEREDWSTNYPTYFLAGVPGLGEGNGIEHFSKGMGLLDVTFYIKKGSLVGTNYTPDFTPGADVTSANTAAGFAGQGSLAVLNSIVYESGYISGAKPPSDAEANVGPNLILNAELGGPKTPASSTNSQSVEGWVHYTSNVSQSYVKNATGSEVPPWGKNNQRVFHTAITANVSSATGRWMSKVSIPIDITKNYNLSGWFRSLSGDSRVFFRLKCFTASGSAATTQYLWTLLNTPVASTWTYYNKAFGPQGEMNFSSDTVGAFVQVYLGYSQISVTQGAGFVLNEGLTPQKIDATEKFALSYLSTVDYSSGFISGTKPPSNATNGATWGSNISGQPSNTALLNSNQNYSDVSGGPPTNADNTGSNTAANIVGQGNFATLNSITTGNISTYIAGAAIGKAQIGTAAIGTLQIENNQTIFVPKLVAFNSAQHTLYAYTPNDTYTLFIPHTVTTFSFANAMAQTSVMLNVRFNGNLQKVGYIINWRVTMLRKIGSGDYVKIGNISNLSPPTGDYEFDVWFTDNPGAGTVSYAIGVELTGDWNFQIGSTIGYFRTNCSGQIVLMGGKR